MSTAATMTITTTLLPEMLLLLSSAAISTLRVDAST